MASKILNFSPDRLITGINIVDNMLFFTDDVNEPKKINITKFRGDATEGEFKNIPVDHSSGTTRIYNRFFEERDITVIKEHPILGPNSAKIDIPFGDEEDDLKPDDIDDKPNIVIDPPAVEDDDEINTPEDLPKDNDITSNFELGVLDVQRLGDNFLSGVGLLATGIKGTLDIEEIYFIYSQTVGSEEDIQTAINALAGGVSANTATEVKAKSIAFGPSKKTGTGSVQIQSTDSSAPGYDANLTAGKLYVTAYMKVKGNSTKVYARQRLILEVKSNTATVVNPEGVTYLRHNVVMPGDPQSLYKQSEPSLSIYFAFDPKKFQSVSKAYLIGPLSLSDNSSHTNQQIIDDGIQSTLGNNITENGYQVKRIVFQNIVLNKKYKVIPSASTLSGVEIFGDEFGNNPSLSATTGHQIINLTEGNSNEINKVVVANLLKPDVFSDNIILKQSWPGFLSIEALNLDFEELEERGFYFAKSAPSNSLKNDFLTATYTTELKPYDDNVYSVSTSSDGKFFKVALENPTASSPIINELGLSEYLTLADGDVISFMSYSVGDDTGVVSTSDIKSATIENTIIEPVFKAGNLSYDLNKDETHNGSNGHSLRLSLEMSIEKLPTNETFKTAGIVISKPYSKSEFNKTESSNNIYNTVQDVINEDNEKRYYKTIEDSEVTFEAHLGDSVIGKYSFDNILIDHINAEDYYNYISSSGSVPTYPNFPYKIVSFVATSEKTYYSDIFPKSFNELNPALLHDDIFKNERSFIGAPRIFAGDEKGNAVSSITSTTVTFNSVIDRVGSDITETGFYYSTTNPEAVPNNNGTSKALTDWSATATKVASSKTITEVNNHIDQMVGVDSNITEYLESSANVTGLTANTEYFVVPYIKPTQISAAQGEKTIGSKPSYNSFINNIKWGEPFSFTTDKNISAVTQEPFFRIDNPSKSEDLGIDFVNLSGNVVNKDANGRIKEIGFYAKPASGFPSSFSDQAGNASHMADAANRLETSEDELSITNDSGLIKLRINNIDTVEYYVSMYCVIEVNGTDTTYISEYISVDNSVNSNKTVLSASNFVLYGATGGGNKNLLNVAIQYPKSDTARVPVDKMGAYYLADDLSTPPLDSREFLEKYNSLGTLYKDTIEITIATELLGSSNYKRSHWAEKTIPIPNSMSTKYFPKVAAKSNKYIHALAYYKYNDINVSPSVEKTVYSNTITLRKEHDENPNNVVLRPPGATWQNIWFYPIGQKVKVFGSRNGESQNLTLPTAKDNFHTFFIDLGDFFIVKQVAQPGFSAYKLISGAPFPSSTNRIFLANIDKLNQASIFYLYSKNSNPATDSPVDAIAIATSTEGGISLPADFNYASAGFAGYHPIKTF